MAGVKISALPAIVTPAITDIYATVQGGVTYQVSGTQLGSLFLPLTGGTMTGALILNTSSPSTALESASKGYVDSVAQGLNIQGACVVATTGALTVTYSNGSSGVGATLTNAGAQAAIAIDGVTLALNDRVLVKNQASTFQNGIYIVTTLGSGATNWVMTRATDYDTPAEIQPGDLVVITSGTVNANSSWLETATVVTIGTDAITFTQFSASLPISVPNGGTGRTTSTTAYGIIAAGTTATGALQTISPGLAGQLFQSAGAAALGTFTTATYPATTTINQLLYSSSNNVIAGLATANSSILVTSAGGVPSLSTTTPAALNIPQPNIVGTTTNDNAAAGSVGEFISSEVLIGSAVSMTTATAANITSISLTAGDWDVWGNFITTVNAATITTDIASGISQTSATLPTPPNGGGYFARTGIASSAGAFQAIPSGYMRLSLASTTTVYLIGYAVFSVNTLAGYGFIGARRRR